MKTRRKAHGSLTLIVLPRPEDWEAALSSLTCQQVSGSLGRAENNETMTEKDRPGRRALLVTQVRSHLSCSCPGWEG